MPTKYDAIIIGGGHNGLVTACYLARAKWKVLVLERRYLVGGACVTEENIFPGYKVSTCAYVNSLFSPTIIQATCAWPTTDSRCCERNPSSFSPFLDGRYLFMGPDSKMNLEQIAKFSKKDAENYPKYEQMLGTVASVIEPTLTLTPPNIINPGIGGMWSLVTLGNSFRKLGTELSEAIEILTGPARTILDRWFESEELKGTLATDAIIGAFAAPSMPGTAYVLFHHVMGETNGKKGVWAYVRGGMGASRNALAAAAKDLGVEIRCNAEVAKIQVRDGSAVGVSLATGEEFQANKVASGVDPHWTFEKFLEPKDLPPDFVAAVITDRLRSASMKINVALSAPPNFTALPSTGIGPQHHGTMHFMPRSRLHRTRLR